MVEDGQATLGEQGLGLEVGLAAVTLGFLVRDGLLSVPPAPPHALSRRASPTFLFRTSKPALLRIFILFSDPRISGAAWANEWVMGGQVRWRGEFAGF